MPVYIGIDWSQTKHDVCSLRVNEAGAPIARQVVAHSPEGFQKLDAQRQQLGVAASECLVGIESAHNLLIDFLWGHDYQQVFVIPPNVVNSTRGRYRQSGARNDQSDAFVLADSLRTDRARLQLWKPDHVLTRQIRSRVSLLNHLTRNAVRLSNRLRAVLWRYYPAALQVFGTLDAQITLEFVRLYSTPQHAAALSLAEFKAFAKRHHYPRPQQLTARFACLQQPQPQADQDTVLVFQGEAIQLSTVLLDLVQTKAASLRELQHLFHQHPDAPIFDSLPGAGELLAPALLAKFGDDRARFPAAASVQALAGTCPVTDASGKRKVITPAPHRQVPGSFARPAIGSFGPSRSSGPKHRWPNQPGPMRIGNRSGRIVTQTVTRTAALPTAGLQWPGSFGRPASPTTRPTICNNVPSIANREPSRRA